MSNPNVLSPTGDTEPRQHQDAASAAVYFATQQESTISQEMVSGHPTPGRDPDVTVEDLPNRFTEKWAVKGLHKGWIGFSSKTGLPK